MKINYNIISEVITNLARSGALPTIDFCKDSPIEMALRVITDASNTPSDLNDVEIAQNWLDQLVGYESPVIDAAIEDLANTLVEGINGSVDIIKAVQLMVGDIVAAMDSKVAEGIALDPKLQALLVEKEISYEFGVFNYSPLDAMGISLMKTMEEAVGITSDSVALAYSSICERYFAMTAGNLVPTPVSIDEDTKNAIIPLVNALSEDWDEDDVKAALLLICSDTRIENLHAKIDALGENKVDRMDDLVEAVHLLAQYGVLIPKIQTALYEAGYDGVVLTGNINIVLHLLEVAAYIASYLRKTLYADTVLFKNDLLNPDKLNELKEKGLTPMDVARHRKIIYGGPCILAQGITLNALISQKEKIDQLYMEGASADELYQKRELYRLQATAIQHELGKVLSAKGYDPTAYLAKLSDANRMIEAPWEDVVFEAIVHFEHANTMVGTLYKLLGKAYTQAIKDNPEITVPVMTAYTLEAYLEVVITVLSKKVIV